MAGLYLSEECFEHIRQAVMVNNQPWLNAYEALIADADAALGQEKLSIRHNGGGRFYRQDAPYLPGKDGQYNQEANNLSGLMASTLSNACFTLAVAWRLTRDGKYADKALELIHAWCIDENTRMQPTGRVESAATPGVQEQGDIVIFARFPGLFQAIYLLKSYAGWELHARAAVLRWVREMVQPCRRLMFYEGKLMSNNWEDARLLYLASGALALDDDELLIEVFDHWRMIIPLKMTDEGQLPRETMRTRSMNYTLFALNSMASVAEIARQYGQDLYDWTVGSRSLKTAVDYAAGYLMNLDAWPFEMIIPFNEEVNHDRLMGLFELAYAYWGDEIYLDILNAHNVRPVNAWRATLLFARP